MHESRLYLRDALMSFEFEVRSVTQSWRKVFFVEPDVAVCCVPLMAGQLRARTPLVGTGEFDAVKDTVKDAVEEVVSPVVEGDGVAVTAAVEGVDCLLLFRELNPPATPPTTPPTMTKATAARISDARFLGMPNQSFGDSGDGSGRVLPEYTNLSAGSNRLRISIGRNFWQDGSELPGYTSGAPSPGEYDSGALLYATSSPS